MKGYIKALAAAASAAVLTGCSGMTEIPDRQSYAEPNWYAECAETGSEGMLWWSTDYVYACGGGQSNFFQAAEEQMYAIAMNQFAKRLNGVVDSQTVMEFEDGNRHTRSTVSYTVKDTAIREHVTHERAKFKYAGEYYTFVRLKMKREVFDQLLEEAKNETVVSDSSSAAGSL